MRKPVKIQVIVYKAKDGFRWHMKMRGRIIAESGEAYTRIAAIRKVLNSILTRMVGGNLDFHFPAKS